MPIVLCIGIVLACAIRGGFAQTEPDTGHIFMPTGFIAFECGQIVKGILPSSGAEIRHGWLERSLLQIGSEFTFADRTKFYLAFEGQLGFSYPQSIAVRESMFARFWMYPARVEGTYSLGKIEAPYLELGFGYFPFKYNKRVVNLGEFLFRSGTYPPYIVNNFNMPFARLLGFRATSRLFGILTQDFLVTSEVQFFPTQDFSLSYLARASFFGAFEIGAGVTLAHLFSIEGRLTDPYDQLPEDQKMMVRYIKVNGDTSHYTFKGTKPMALFGFDPKPLFPDGFFNFLGKNDLSIYGEICVIGWTNYKNYSTDTNFHFPDYANRWDRTPFMFGINIPAFKQLDVFSFEIEHNSTKYPNSYQSVTDMNLPVYMLLTGKPPAAWKWSIYAKRTFWGNFSLIGQIARDHMRPAYPSYLMTERDDVVPRPGDWWWALRLMVKY